VERVFLDTNVLYPISIADLLLRLGDVALHAIVWSEDLLTEVKRVLVEDKGLTSAQAAYFCRCVREEFADDEVRREDYEHLVDTMTGKDPGDHAHAAAARVAATVLLTFNVDDFPEQDMGGVRVMTPDDYSSTCSTSRARQCWALSRTWAPNDVNPNPSPPRWQPWRRPGSRRSRNESELCGDQRANTADRPPSPRDLSWRESTGPGTKRIGSAHGSRKAASLRIEQAGT
jgi:hypothetical protein